MKFILVVDRKHLFPGLSPQGLLPPDAVDMSAVERHAFFAEREYMENCSHFKQIIPYMALTLGDEVLCYQRQAKHSEKRLGGLWTIGFGGHIEPVDRHTAELEETGLMKVSALRELREETGLELGPEALELRGTINSEANDVSTVHFGIFYGVDLRPSGLSREAVAELVLQQAEPHAVRWRSRRELRGEDGAPGPAPEGGTWENWTEIALAGI
jgi:predicted NUDIX family phosphoesterase